MSTYTPQQRVLLLELSERTSAKGRKYMSGWLGKASVVAFQAEEPDKFGNVRWEVFVTEPQQREKQQRMPATQHVGGAPTRQQLANQGDASPPSAGAVVDRQGAGWRGSQYRRPANGPQRGGHHKGAAEQDGAFEDAGPIDLLRAG